MPDYGRSDLIQNIDDMCEISMYLSDMDCCIKRAFHESAPGMAGKVIICLIVSEGMKINRNILQHCQ